MNSSRNKIIGIDAASDAIRRAQRRNERIVFTNGCFDLLHVGHVRSLEAARALGDRLIVAVNHDGSVRRAKGLDRPIQTAVIRKQMVAALDCVDWVVGFNTDTPLRLIERFRPDVLAKGGDWTLNEIVGRAEVESWGGRVERLPIIRGHSTTETIRRIRAKGSPRRKR